MQKACELGANKDFFNPKKQQEFPMEYAIRILISKNVYISISNENT